MLNGDTLKKSGSTGVANMVMETRELDMEFSGDLKRASTALGHFWGLRKQRSGRKLGRLREFCSTHIRPWTSGQTANIQWIRCAESKGADQIARRMETFGPLYAVDWGLFATFSIFVATSNWSKLLS